MSDTNPAISWDDDDEDDYKVDPPVTVAAPPVLTSNSVLTNDNDFNPTSIVAVEQAESDGDSEKMTVVQVDADGNEVTVTIDLALPPLNEEEAREITERIKTTTNVLYVLIKRAHAGKAWSALGYTSFESYVREEFNYSRSYAYKLLNQAQVIEAIENAAPAGTEVYVGELTARGLKKSLPELIQKVEERTSDVDDPEEAAAIIEDIIRETKERKDEEDNFDEDFDDFNPGDYSSPSSAFDYVDDDEDDLDDFLGGDDDPTAVVNKLENLYTLLTGLQNFSDLSSKDNLRELLPLIPTDRRSEVTRLVSVNAEWAEKLKSEWETYLAENAVSNDGEDDSADSFGDDEY